MKNLLPSLIVLLLCAFGFAQDTCFGEPMKWMLGSEDLQGGGSFALNNSPTLIYAIGFVIFLLVGAYMLGRAWQDQKLIFWAKTEGVNFVISIVLIFVVIAAFIGSCEISQAIAKVDGDTSPAQSASASIKKISDMFGVTLATDLLKSSVGDQFQAMFYAYWTVPALDGGGLAYKANTRAFSAQKELLIDIYLPLLMMVDMQRLFLDVALPGVIAVILPSALFFRMIFATRDIGNILIALAFAIYFVFPLTYILALDATDGVVKLMGGTDDNPFGKVELARSGVPGMEDAFLKIGYVSAIAILLPNIAMIGTVTMTMSLYKALKGFGV